MTHSQQALFIIIAVIVAAAALSIIVQLRPDSSWHDQSVHVEGYQYAPTIVSSPGGDCTLIGIYITTAPRDIESNIYTITFNMTIKEFDQYVKEWHCQAPPNCKCIEVRQDFAGNITDRTFAEFRN